MGVVRASVKSLKSLPVFGARGFAGVRSQSAHSKLCAASPEGETSSPVSVSHRTQVNANLKARRATQWSSRGAWDARRYLG